MLRVDRLAGLAGMTLLLASPFLHAQGRGGGAWTTSQGDAQRSGWMRNDAKVSVESMQKPGFRFLWKNTLDNRARELHNLTQPLTLPNIISYKGFKALAFVGGSSDTVFSIDYDLNRMFWTRRLPAVPPNATSTIACPGALTTITRQTNVAPPVPAARGGGGGGGRGGNVNTIAIGSSGMVHVLNPQTGEDTAPPVKFLPAKTTASAAILIDSTVYAATVGNCGGAADGVYAVNLAPDSGNPVVSWNAGGAPIAGTAGPAFGTDGTVYVATGRGPGTAFSIVALDGKSLAVKGSFTSTTPFSSSPVVFAHQGRDLVAATNRDGKLYLVDSAAMTAPPVTSAVYGSGSYATGALATWADAGGTRWILVPAAGTLGSGFSANGAVTNGAMLAFKVVEEGGRLSLQPAWASRDLVSPVAPLVMNGVVFALSSGEFRDAADAAGRAQRSSPAVLYALDGTTGKELWNSGRTMTSFVHDVPPAGSDSQVYIVTHDGTLYAFGMPMER